MMSAGGMNAGMMNINRADARAMAARAGPHMESLPLPADHFQKVRLSSSSVNEYEHVALALLENALERTRKERIYGGADESWRDMGAMHGFKRFTKMEGHTQHYRIEGVVRAPMTNVMALMYAERNSSIPERRNVFYGNGLDGQTLHVLRERTAADRHQHMTLRWEAMNISTATDNLKFDLCFLEYTGITVDQDGQAVGFKISHSIDFPQCKSLLKSHGLHRLEGTEIMTLRPTGNNSYTDFILEGSFQIEERLPATAISAFLTQIAQQLGRIPMEIQSRRLAAMKIMDKSLWVPTNERKNCSVCLSRFSMLGKKHHCRSCGEVVCKSCVVSRPHRDEIKFCKKCVVVACSEDELVIPERSNPLHTPSSHSSSSSSSRHREARDSYASSLNRQSDERSSGPAMMEHPHYQSQQSYQPVMKPVYARPQHHDLRYVDDLKHMREDNNSMTASETSFGSSTFSSGGFIESSTPSFDVNESYCNRPDGSMIYLDTKSMTRGPGSVSSTDDVPYGSGRGYERTPQVMQDVETSLAQQRYLLQEMMHQANRTYRSNPAVKNHY